MTYQLNDTREESDVKERGSLPDRIHMPGKFSLSPVKDSDRQSDYLLVEVECRRSGATKSQKQAGKRKVREGSKVTVTPSYDSPTVQQAKNVFIARVKQVSREKLAETDWMIVQSIECGGNYVLNAEHERRAAIRTHANSLEAEIDTRQTLAELNAWAENGWSE